MESSKTVLTKPLPATAVCNTCNSEGSNLCIDKWWPAGCVGEGRDEFVLGLIVRNETFVGRGQQVVR